MKNSQNPEDQISMELRFNKYEGGVNESGKSMGSTNNSIRFGADGNQDGNISPGKKGATSLHKQALMNKSQGMPQIDSFRSTNTMKSDQSPTRSPQKDAGEKTSLHDVDDNKAEEEMESKSGKKISSFQKEAMSPGKSPGKKAPGSPLKKQLGSPDKNND